MSSRDRSDSNALGLVRISLVRGSVIVAALLVANGTPSSTSPSTARQPAPASSSSAPAPAERTSAASPPAGVARPLSPREALLLRRYQARVERLRGLRFLRDFPTEVWSAERIAQHLSESAAEEDLARSKSLYVGLGLLPADADIRAALAAVIGEQVVGFYDHEAGRLVVRDDIMRELALGEHLEAELVILHELVHALQDQHFDLHRRLEAELSVDESNGLRALIEGDATLAMLGDNLPAAALAAMRASPLMLDVAGLPVSAEGSEVIRAQPAIIRVSFTAPYLTGLRFCATMLDEGGWPAVDGVFARPPRSVEQVLHPARYLRGEEPVAIALPAIPEIEAAGYRPSEDETLGELEMAVYFGQRSDGVDARAAEGWAGDRLRVYERTESTESTESPAAIVWFSLWDDESEAAEAEASARAVAPAEGLVRRDGRALLIARNLPAPLREAVAAAFARWRSDDG